MRSFLDSLVEHGPVLPPKNKRVEFFIGRSFDTRPTPSPGKSTANAIRVVSEERLWFALHMLDEKARHDPTLDGDDPPETSGSFGRLQKLIGRVDEIADELERNFGRQMWAIYMRALSIESVEPRADVIRRADPVVHLRTAVGQLQQLRKQRITNRRAFEYFGVVADKVFPTDAKIGTRWEAKKAEMLASIIREASTSWHVPPCPSYAVDDGLEHRLEVALSAARLTVEAVTDEDWIVEALQLSLHRANSADDS